MNRDELLKHCRYYKGEDKCPFDDDDMAWFWSIESRYVRRNGELNKDVGDYYLVLGGQTYPDIPFNLLIDMVAVWGKYAYNLKDCLPQFYNLIEDYLSKPIKTLN